MIGLYTGIVPPYIFDSFMNAHLSSEKFPMNAHIELIMCDRALKLVDVDSDGSIDFSVLAVSGFTVWWWCMGSSSTKLVEVLGDNSFMMYSGRWRLCSWIYEGIENVSSQSGALFRSVNNLHRRW